MLVKFLYELNRYADTPLEISGSIEPYKVIKASFPPCKFFSFSESPLYNGNYPINSRVLENSFFRVGNSPYDLNDYEKLLLTNQGFSWHFNGRYRCDGGYGMNMKTETPFSYIEFYIQNPAGDADFLVLELYVGNMLKPIRINHLTPYSI